MKIIVLLMSTLAAFVSACAEIPQQPHPFFTQLATDLERHVYNEQLRAKLTERCLKYSAQSKLFAYYATSPESDQSKIYFDALRSYCLSSINRAMYADLLGKPYTSEALNNAVDSSKAYVTDCISKATADTALGTIDRQAELAALTQIERSVNWLSYYGSFSRN